MSCAWVVIDMQLGFDTPALRKLAERIHAAVLAEAGPVWALVQVNPQDGPLRVLRGWDGCSSKEDAQLLDPVRKLSPQEVVKVGYGARADLPFAALAKFGTVFVAGADTDACVLATSLALFDAGVSVVVRSDLCLSSGGSDFHAAAVKVLTRQLGPGRVLGHGAVPEPGGTSEAKPL